MMWKLLFLLVATCVVADPAVGPGCRQLISETCHDKDTLPDDIPGTEQELEAFCNYSLKYMECANRVVENCETDEDHLLYLQEMTTSVIRVCDKNSLLYNALVGVTPCFKENNMVLFSPCLPLNQEITGTISEALARIGVLEVTTSDNITTPCLQALYAAACSAAKAGQVCGSAGREVAIDILGGFNQNFESCGPGMKETLPTIAQVLQLEAEKEAALESKIKKRK